MNLEDYNEYYIQGSDHYLIPKDVFIELFSEMENWKEESKQLKAKLEMYENGVYYSSENDKLKEVIEEVREYILNHELVEEKDHYVLNGNELLQILDKAMEN